MKRLANVVNASLLTVFQKDEEHSEMQAIKNKSNSNRVLFLFHVNHV